jgi:2'-5' RNA ligase
MRLFLAIPLPPPVAHQVQAVLSELRGTGWPVRWVQDGNTHITLKFYGEVPPERLDAIGEVARNAVQGAEPIGLTLGETGAFPSLRRARIIRVDVEPEPRLELLQDRIERGSEAIGYPPEGRPFFPHITLGRVREGERLPPEAAPLLEKTRIRQSFLADRFVLYESRQSPQGPVYHERVVERLGDDPA